MKQPLLRSFILGGFESTTGYNMHRQWIDQIAATQHDQFVDDDYRRLTEIGIHGARDAIRWPLVDKNGGYDFSTVRPILEAGRRHGVDIIYDLFHFGFPPDVDLLGPDFPDRFANYCHAAAHYVSQSTDGTCYFTPINEPSYFSWAAGEIGLFAPHLHERGSEMKVNLIRGLIKAIDAIWSAVPRARIVNVDSLCRVVVPTGRIDLQREADNFNSQAVFQSWDMLSGRLLPELGGSSHHLDIMGVNYYWTNQWELNRAGIPLEPNDPRRWPLRRLLEDLWMRYGADIMLTETAHVDDMRAPWIRELSNETHAIFDTELPLRGICIYPILGMTDWHDQELWTRMGLWDLVADGNILTRVPYRPMLEALNEMQHRLSTASSALPSGSGRYQSGRLPRVDPSENDKRAGNEGRSS